MKLQLQRIITRQTSLTKLQLQRIFNCQTSRKELKLYDAMSHALRPVISLNSVILTA